MSEIKFRAWLNERGRMVYFNLFEPDGEYIIKEEVSVREDDPVMQYTGLKDKNGKEIYEGDMLGWTYYCETKKITEQSIVKWNNKHAYFDFGDDTRPTFCEREVIGNIYENKL